MITKIYKLVFATCAICGMASCSDFFDQQSEHVVFTENNKLDNATDTIYSVIGILNKLQSIADRTILLGEVRGDLVDITNAANSDLRDMALFSIGDDNRYNQPRDYYAIINNCNYFIANVDTAMKNNRNEYVFMREYAAVKSIRAWTYLQLVLNYGNVPFVIEPILNKADAEKNYPKYDLQAVCEYFIQDLAPLTDRWGNEYPEYGTIRSNASRLFYFPLNIVLGDLNLWLASKTKNQATYREAAMRYYKYINERNGNNSSYPIGLGLYTWAPGSGDWNRPERSLSSGSLTSETTGTNAEIITMIAGDSIPAEGHYSELRNLFNSQQDNDYRASIVPSTYMFDLSSSQVHCCVGTNGTTFYYAPAELPNYMSGDLRLYQYYSESVTTDRLSGERIETSYIDKYSSQNVHIYRRQMLYLRLAEALNGAGFPRAAFSMLSTGLNNDVIRQSVLPYCSQSDSTWISRLSFPRERYGIYTVDELATNRTEDNHNTLGIHTRGSGWTPFNEYYQLIDNPLPEVEYDENGDPIIVPIPKDTPELTQKQQAFVDSLLLNECGLELAFEGTRFYDIMRFAFRQSNPGQFLAEKVYARRGKENSGVMRGEIKKDLSDERNWYLQWNGQIGM
ncbi:MAG: RagB/SusD family nutrient uptake outer membrane protein [Prevotella sp.]|nr:RagB/SusD family nutrient uptake outer membrane protein [Prevotella sp.]